MEQQASQASRQRLEKILRTLQALGSKLSLIIRINISHIANLQALQQQLKANQRSQNSEIKTEESGEKVARPQSYNAYKYFLQLKEPLFGPIYYDRKINLSFKLLDVNGVQFQNKVKLYFNVEVLLGSGKQLLQNLSSGSVVTFSPHSYVLGGVGKLKGMRLFQLSSRVNGKMTLKISLSPQSSSQPFNPLQICPLYIWDLQILAKKRISK